MTSIATTAGHSISVVIPVKDDAPHLRRCLAVLAPQLLPGDELVIVDNGSSDDSAAVAVTYGALVVRVTGGGIPAASSAGYDAASREIIARLDADSLPGDDWLATIRLEFARDARLTAITGPAHFTDGPRALRGLLASAYLGAYFLSLLPLLRRVPLFGSNCAFRRSAWDAARGTVHRTDPVVHDDLDLSFHLPPGSRVRFRRSLVMGISMRPLFDRSALAWRFRRGAHTVAVHFPGHLESLDPRRRPTLALADAEAAPAPPSPAA